MSKFRDQPIAIHGRVSTRWEERRRLRRAQEATRLGGRGSKLARWFEGGGGETDLVVMQETLGDVLPLLETVNQFMVGPASRGGKTSRSVRRSMTTSEAGQRSAAELT